MGAKSLAVDMKPANQPVSVRISPELKKLLENLSQKKNLSLSKTIVLACDTYVNNHKQISISKRKDTARINEISDYESQDYSKIQDNILKIESILEEICGENRKNKEDLPSEFDQIIGKIEQNSIKLGQVCDEKTTQTLEFLDDFSKMQQAFADQMQSMQTKTHEIIEHSTNVYLSIRRMNDEIKCFDTDLKPVKKKVQNLTDEIERISRRQHGLLNKFIITMIKVIATASLTAAFLLGFESLRQSYFAKPDPFTMSSDVLDDWKNR
ncbi:MAG: hypothetical protein HRU19_32475 [Pseudobacteriovorax sp.]|nr:hypothetical protein [Pseudobacteriovorax sp.]